MLVQSGGSSSGSRRGRPPGTQPAAPLLEERRPQEAADGDYAAWGLHLWGDGLAPGQATAEWTNPTPFEATDAYGALHRITLVDDTKRVGFIVHRRPPGDPNVKDTDPDRYFIPLSTPEIWLRQGDPRIYSCPAADDTCVVPSA